MSFRCHVCNEAQENGTSPNVFVKESRNVVYPERKNKDETKVIDCGGKGWEIVKEIWACDKCVAARQKEKDAQ